MTKVRNHLVLALLLLVAVPPAAQAGHWLRNANWNIIHLNRGRAPALSFYNNAVNGSRDALEHARGDWSARAAGLDLWNWASNSADVVAWDGYWSGSALWGWQTSVAASQANMTYADGHTDQMWVQINISRTGTNYDNMRAVACHELGHAIGGMNHQGPGCQMSPLTNTSDPAQRVPSDHDINDHANPLWLNMH